MIGITDPTISKINNISFSKCDLLCGMSYGANNIYQVIIYMN